jgi:hyperosmotically inducible protein
VVRNGGGGRTEGGGRGGEEPRFKETSRRALADPRRDYRRMKTYIFGLRHGSSSQGPTRPAPAAMRRGGGLLVAALSALILGQPFQQPLHAASETDENLEASARGAYVFRTFLAGEGVTMEVSNGMVTLRGSVAIALQRELAEEAVAALPGVKSIDNEITVTPAPPGAADQQLALRVKTILGLHRSGRAHAARLEASEGVVTLKGEAENEALRSLAAEYAADVEGVVAVRNELTLPKSKLPHTEATKPAAGASGPEPAPASLAAAPEVDDPSVVAQVRMALRAHRSTRSLKPGVESREGVVTLTGHLTSVEERDLVSRLCSDILGVRRVENRMTPEPESTEN